MLTVQNKSDTLTTTKEPQFMYDLGISIEPARESAPPTGKGVAALCLAKLDSLTSAFYVYKATSDTQLSKLSGEINFLTNQIEILQNQIFESPYASLSNRPLMYSEREGNKYFKKGNEAYIKQNYKIAIDLFSKAISSQMKRSKIGDAYYWIGNCYIHLGDEHLTLAYLKKVAEYPLSGKSADALFLTAITYRKMGNRKMATIFLKRIIKKHPRGKLAKLSNLELKKMNSIE